MMSMLDEAVLLYATKFHIAKVRGISEIHPIRWRFWGSQGGHGPRSRVLAAEKGHDNLEKLKLNLKKRLSTPCAFYLCLEGRSKQGVWQCNNP